MAESEELKRLLRKVKEKNEKADLKLNILKPKIMASCLKANRRGKVGSDTFYFLGFHNH